MDTVPEFHAEAPQATVSEELAQGPYVAARAGFEPTTLRLKAIDSNNAPPRPTHRKCTESKTHAHARTLPLAVKCIESTAHTRAHTRAHTKATLQTGEEDNEAYSY